MLQTVLRGEAKIGLIAFTVAAHCAPRKKGFTAKLVTPEFPGIMRIKKPFNG